MFFTIRTNYDNSGLLLQEIFILNYLKNEVFSAYFKLLDQSVLGHQSNKATKEIKFLRYYLEDQANHLNSEKSMIDAEILITVDHDFNEYKRVACDAALAV